MQLSVRSRNPVEELSLRPIKFMQPLQKEASQPHSRIKHYDFEQDQWKIASGFSKRPKGLQESGLSSTMQNTKFSSHSKLIDGTKSSASLLIKKHGITYQNVFSMSNKNMVETRGERSKKDSQIVDGSLYSKEPTFPKLKMNEIRGMLDVAQNLCNIAHLDKLAKRDLPIFFDRSQTLMTSTEGNAPLHKNSIILDQSMAKDSPKVGHVSKRPTYLKDIPSRVLRNYAIPGKRIDTEYRLPTDKSQVTASKLADFQASHKIFKKNSKLGFLSLEPDNMNHSKLNSIDTNGVFKMVNKVEERQKKNMLQIRLNAHTVLLKKLYIRFKDESNLKNRELKEMEMGKVARVHPKKVRKRNKRKVDELSRRFQEVIYNQTQKLEDMLLDIKDEYRLEGDPDDVSKASPAGSRKDISPRLYRNLNIDVEEIKPMYKDIDAAFSSSQSMD